MSKKILLTRPLIASKRWEKLLARRGFDCVIEPLLTVTATGLPRPAGDFQAVMITSANAIDVLGQTTAPLSDLFGLPCFCVGPASGDAARALGFTVIESGASDSDALAQLVLKSLPDASRPILHIAGDVVDGKAEERLSRQGYSCVLWRVYQAGAVDDLTPALKAQIAAGAIDIIPVFSPRSARILVSLIEKNRLGPACHLIAAVALSQPIGDVLQSLPWRHLTVAASPNENDLIACLQTARAVQGSAAPHRPDIKTSVTKRPLLKFFRLAAIGAATAGALAFFMLMPMPVSPSATRGQVTVPVAAANPLTPIEQRLRALETRVDSLTAASSVPPPASDAGGEMTALQEQVKDLQTQFAASQRQARQLPAAAMNFSLLQTAISEGTAFTGPLTRLKKLSSGTTSLQEDLEQLTPFAAQGVPTAAQLATQLEQRMQQTAPVTVIDDTSSWQEKARNWFRPLISVHQTSDPLLMPVVQALRKNDLADAQNRLQSLPAETQQTLADWSGHLQDRLQLNKLLDDLLQRLSDDSDTTPGAAP